MDMTRLSDSGWDENRVNLLMVKAIDVVCRGLDYDLQNVMSQHLVDKYRAMTRQEFLSYIRNNAPHLMEGL